MPESIDQSNLSKAPTGTSTQKRKLELSPNRNKKPVYDPAIDSIKELIEEKKKALEELDLDIENSGISILLNRYKFPALELLVKDFQESRNRLITQMTRVVEKLDDFDSKNDDELTTAKLIVFGGNIYRACK